MSTAMPRSGGGKKKKKLFTEIEIPDVTNTRLLDDLKKKKQKTNPISSDRVFEYFEVFYLVRQNPWQRIKRKPKLRYFLLWTYNFFGFFFSFFRSLPYKYVTLNYNTEN